MLSDFYPSALKGSTKWCKPCMKASTKLWNSKNPEAGRARVHRYYRKHKEALSEKAKWRRQLKRYGLTKDQYTVMLAHQEHCCAICHDSLIGQLRVSTDHNHETNKVRGILCNDCNRGIGLLKDNSAVLTRAAHYVLA
jgi:hypothetical protein